MLNLSLLFLIIFLNGENNIDILLYNKTNLVIILWGR